MALLARVLLADRAVDALGLLAEPGPASQPAEIGPIEVFETRAGLPSWPAATQPPPDEPPVIVQPMRYIVGSSWRTERRPGLSWHRNSFWPSNGGAAG